MKANILLTGHSRGIGGYIGKKLSRDNSLIGISRNYSDIYKPTKEFKIDLKSEKNFHEVRSYCHNENIKLDAVILNAGIAYFGDFYHAELQLYQDIIHTNLLSNINILHALEDCLNKDVKIIFIGSHIAKKSLKGAAVYQASKFGVRGLAMALKNEFKRKSVYLINPGIVDTTFHDTIPIGISLPKNKQTNLETIYSVVQDCIVGKETRFEIDI